MFSSKEVHKKIREPNILIYINNGKSNNIFKPTNYLIRA